MSIENRRLSERVMRGLELLDEFFGRMDVTVRSTNKGSRNCYHATPPYRCDKLYYPSRAANIKRADAISGGMSPCGDCRWEDYETHMWGQR